MDKKKLGWYLGIGLSFILGLVLAVVGVLCILASGAARVPGFVLAIVGGVLFAGSYCTLLVNLYKNHVL